MITHVGEPNCGGAYLLRLRVNRPVVVTFGRFQGGQAIDVPAGEYLYIGSARKSWTQLGRRLLRHGTRTGRLPGQTVRAELGRYFGLEKPAGKKLHWHIDYLLDCPQTELRHVYLRTDAPTIDWEQILAQKLNQDPECHAFAPGLGASDHDGYTHLLRVEADEAWWGEMVNWLIG